MNEKIIWTIGHSTHSFDEFLHMLKSFQIELVADIRSLPGSAKFPHFNKESLGITLPDNNIEYIHFIDLGGRRKPKPDSRNTRWEHAAFRGYADYMETEQFLNAAENLESSASKNRTAYMCAESLWWKCHRSLVSDFLKLRGWTVIHITGLSKGTEHTYTQPARIIDGRLNYTSD